MEIGMKTKSKISGQFIRGGAWAVFLSVAFVALTSASNSPSTWQSSANQPRTFSFAERIAFQRAIEDVYWRHRIWPKENPDPKPSLDAVMSQTQLKNKVAGYLRDSLTLEDYGQPITAEQLQAEMDRMARDTKQSEVLRELFEALGNDPAVIAECLARPILAERLIADSSAQRQTRRVESQQTEAPRAMSVATMSGQIVYTLPEIADTCADDTWTLTTPTNAPAARYEQTAVWTGSEMIVWGGIGEPGPTALKTGGKYNPSTNSWTATSTINAPTGRQSHTAVWTGTEMIVWGGDDLSPAEFNTGGRYNPSTNSWTATSTSNAPAPRSLHTAVWTGSEMLIWGGSNLLTQTDFNTGGRYNPSTNSWTATSTVNAPSARYEHTAVWAGSKMIVWGGIDHNPISVLNTGGRYDPGTDTWTTTSTTNAPSARRLHTAVWTGSEMIVWGGSTDGDEGNTGGRYNPGTNSWRPTSTTNAPNKGYAFTGVWTGSEMIVWGGVGSCCYENTGGRYDPSTNSWRTTSTTNALPARYLHTAVWTGSEMIVWGGRFGEGPHQFSNRGGRYCAQPGLPLTIIQPNGGEVWLTGSVQQIRWEGTNLTNSDRLIIQYSRNGGASWFRIAQDVPALSLSYSWQVDNYPTTQGRVKILLQGNLSITDQSDADFTVQRP
jgi:N-acetylneuraminic acid mutarotase